ncbi:hypothetical protein [Streptomyces violascens]|uniref:hypothetical protein n=1 Tax=Streptomyces violascens TaxID=67381 RepID=UPI00366835BB
MDYIPRQAAHAPPFEGTDILLRYSFEHPSFPYEFEDILEVWSVQIVQYHGEGGCPHCPPDEGECLFEDGTPIGNMATTDARASHRTGQGPDQWIRVQLRRCHTGCGSTRSWSRLTGPAGPVVTAPRTARAQEAGSRRRERRS